MFIATPWTPYLLTVPRQTVFLIPTVYKNPLTSF